MVGRLRFWKESLRRKNVQAAFTEQNSNDQVQSVCTTGSVRETSTFKGRLKATIEQIKAIEGSQYQEQTWPEPYQQLANRLLGKNLFQRE